MAVHQCVDLEAMKTRLQLYQALLKGSGQSLEEAGARVLYNFLERYGFICYHAFGPYWPALKDIFIKQGLLTGTPSGDRDMAAAYCGATDEETIVMAEMFRDEYLNQYTPGDSANSGCETLFFLGRQDRQDERWGLFDPEMEQLSQDAECDDDGGSEEEFDDEDE